MEMVCMSCGRKANVTSEQVHAGSYRCPGCHRQIKILSPAQARSLVRELSSVYARHIGRGRVRVRPGVKGRTVHARKKG